MNARTLSGWWTAALICVAAGLAIYFTAYVWRRIDQPQSPRDTAAVMNKGDFSYFYGAALAMRQGSDIYQVKVQGPSETGYIYPPLIAWLYQPLTVLPINTAARISLLVNIAALAAAMAIMARALLEAFVGRKDWRLLLAVAVCAAILSTDKLKGELQMLQTNVFVALAVAVALWRLDKPRWGFLWAGAALGFAMNVKYQTLALVPYLILRRRWKALAATVASSAAWALLPAATIGVSKDVAYLREGFSGLLRVVGIRMPGDASQDPAMASSFSVSITSATARFLETHALPGSPMMWAGLIGIVWLAVLYALYRQRGARTFSSLPAVPDERQRWRGQVAVEWLAVIVAVLAFSPQTNTRHLVLTALVMELGVVIFMQTRGTVRLVTAGAMVILWMGLNLPPGRRDVATEIHAVQIWHGIGGPAWALLAATTLLLWASMRQDGSASRPAAATAAGPSAVAPAIMEPV